MKVHIGHDGKIVTYGFDGEKLANYRKHGLYVKDDDPRLNPVPRHWPWQHSYDQVRSAGMYDSITGPRTIVVGTCACGKTMRWTVRGTL